MSLGCLEAALEPLTPLAPRRNGKRVGSAHVQASGQTVSPPPPPPITSSHGPFSRSDFRELGCVCSFHCFWGREEAKRPLMRALRQGCADEGVFGVCQDAGP